MVIPFTSSVARGVLRAVPQGQREGAYALGATRWEAIRMALFYARTGIIGSVMLGFGRALGETMAVTMLIGNNPQITWSLYAPQYTMAAVLANEFTEADNDLYLNALIEIGLVLFIITPSSRPVAHAHLVDGATETTPARSSDASAGDGVMRDRWRAASRMRSSCSAAQPSCSPWCHSLRVVLRRHAGCCRSIWTSSRTCRSRWGIGRRHGQRDRRLLIVTGLGRSSPSRRRAQRRLCGRVRRNAVRSGGRFAADTLNGVPSIVIGVFVYGIAVLPFRQFSALAGGLALGIMMIPLIMRTTEELLLLVPSTLREGALALGATRARAVFTVVLPAALPGIITGILLALARIAGETAPLLFTSLNNRFWSTDVTQPIATLTVQVFAYAIAPYEDWHRQAWAGALVLVAIVLLCSLLARVATARMERLQRGA